MIITENDITDLSDRIRKILLGSNEMDKTYLRLARMITKIEKEQQQMGGDGK